MPKATVEYFQDAQKRNDWKMDVATPEQQEKILQLVDQALDEGALGIGINAGYAPGYGRLAVLQEDERWQYLYI
ncbi:hypothetical protein ACFL1J_06290 [Pseudomonadota bacterium]|jgi:N-acyl-D-glutamate deacylase